MADALRELLAVFSVQVDPEGNLAKGEKAVDALKIDVEALGRALDAVKAKAAPAAAAVSDVFSKAMRNANLAMQSFEAKAFSGRQNSDGFMQAGLAKAKRDADAAANSFGSRLSRAFDRASAGAMAFGKRLTAGGTGSVVGGLTALRAGIVGAVAVTGARFAKGFIDQVGGMAEAAAKLGVSVEEFQRLDVFAKQNATSVEALGTAFRNLGRLAGDPTKDSASAFGALGVSTTDGNGALKSRQDLFFETAGALADVGNETKRAQLATQLFGRSGTELLPILANGRAGLEAQREALEKMAVITSAQSKEADEFSDRWELASANLRTKLVPILLRLIPAFEHLIQFVGKAVDMIANTGKALDALAASSSGGAGAVRALKFSLDLLLLPLKLLEDFIVFLAGGKSRIGVLLEQAFGADNDAAATLRAFFDGVFGGFNELAAFLNGETSTDDFVVRFLAATDEMSEAIDALIEKVVGLPRKMAEAALGFDAVGTTLRSLPVVGPLLTAAGATSVAATAVSETPVADLFGAGIGVSDPNARFGGMPAPTAIDQRTQSVTVNVGSTAEVSGAVSGAQRGMGRDSAANLAAVQ